MSPIDYPEARRSDHVDTYHGVEVPDPYRWLEDPDSAESRAWIDAQNRATESFLGAIPARERLQARLTELWNYPRFGLPTRREGLFLFSHNSGLQDQPVVLKASGPEAEPETLLDPNTLSSDGTVALSGTALSEDGSLLAYGLSEAGSDWMTWKVRRVETGEDLEDTLRWIKFSGAAWTHDGKGFFYSRYAEPDPDAPAEAALRNQKLYYHTIGQDQSEDRLVYERPDQPEWGFHADVTDDGRYVVITVWQGTDPKNGVFVLDLEEEDGPVREVLADFDASYTVVGNRGSELWVQTDLDAPRGRVIALEMKTPGERRELIPQSEDTLEFTTVLDQRFVVGWLRDAHARVTVHGLDGALDHELELPGLGSVGGFAGRPHDTDTYFAFTSFTQPTTIFRYDLRGKERTVWRAPEVPFDPTQFVTEQVFVDSPDGTKVPLFLSHRKDVTPDGSRRVYLYGYGGFNHSLTPAFSVSPLVWMEEGGVLAVACLRGGGEYGEDWHQAGVKANKQNVFDDALACAEWLTGPGGWARPETLAIGGGSNGGLLVGACITQRPELFGAALPAVGVLDMLRFHEFTIGWAWVSEYGSSADAEEFQVLRAYSPLHNLRPGTRYPAVLVTTADHDDRVVPAHSFKFAAALQHAQAGDAPTLIRIEVKAGHGAGKPTSKVIAEAADRWAFLLATLTPQS